MRSRSGFTLTEALIGIGILTIGLIALLSLFPVGASQIAQTFKDERCGQLATISDNTMRVIWRNAWISQDPQYQGLINTDSGQIQTFDPYYPANPSSPGPPPVVNAAAALNPSFSYVSHYELPFIHAMDDPNMFQPTPPVPTAPARVEWQPPAPFQPLPAGVTSAFVQPVNEFLNTPSWPVLIDPVAVRTAPTLDRRFWVTSSSNPTAFPKLLPRRTLTFRAAPILDTTITPNTIRRPWVTLDQAPGFTDTRQRTLRMCTLLDDLSFGPNGRPAPIDREGRYSVAWMIQRPDNSKRSEVNLTIITYQSRPLTDASPIEEVYVPITNNISGLVQPIASPTGAQLTIDLSGNRPRPPLHKGGWIMLVGGPNFALPGTQPADYPYADFYRVLNYTEDQATQRMTFDLDRPLRPRRFTATPQNPLPYCAQVIVMDKVAEVFDRGIMSPNGAPVAP